jgi:hypothetical protein
LCTVSTGHKDRTLAQHPYRALFPEMPVQAAS